MSFAMELTEKSDRWTRLFDLSLEAATAAKAEQDYAFKAIGDAIKTRKEDEAARFNLVVSIVFAAGGPLVTKLAKKTFASVNELTRESSVEAAKTLGSFGAGKLAPSAQVDGYSHDTSGCFAMLKTARDNSAAAKMTFLEEYNKASDKEKSAKEQTFRQTAYFKSAPTFVGSSAGSSALFNRFFSLFFWIDWLQWRDLQYWTLAEAGYGDSWKELMNIQDPMIRATRGWGFGGKFLNTVTRPSNNGMRVQIDEFPLFSMRLAIEWARSSHAKDILSARIPFAVENSALSSAMLAQIHPWMAPFNLATSRSTKGNQEGKK